MLIEDDNFKSSEKKHNPNAKSRLIADQNTMANSRMASGFENQVSFHILLSKLYYYLNIKLKIDRNEWRDKRNSTKIWENNTK